jgi:tetratricopeptide (TPR) repeat protein
MKSHHENEVPRYSRRQMRFAEAGVLFVLILAVVVVVGVKVASRSGGPTAPAIVETDAAPVAIVTVANSETASDPATQVETETPALEVEVTSTVQPPAFVSYAEAEATYLEGRYGDAADLFALYTEQHSDNAWGYYMLGLALWKDGSPAAAEEALLAALERNPDHVKSLVNLGRVRLDLNRPDEARECCERAVQLDPDSPDAYRVLGRAYHNLDRSEAAVQAFQDALRRDESDAWSLNNLGLLLIEQERWDEALPPLAKAVDLRGDVACFQNNLGMALERSGRYAAAAEAYGHALDLNSSYAKAEVNLARVERLSESPDLPVLDLAALAASFQVGPPTVAELDSEVGTESMASEETAAAPAEQAPGVAELASTLDDPQAKDPAK